MGVHGPIGDQQMRRRDPASGLIGYRHVRDGYGVAMVDGLNVHRYVRHGRGVAVVGGMS